ncbi:hypothetical protein [Idiomarina abyssalis]|uniref:hypothetical protein n=1 Tax=Idiomarina abyssalis TaxID=86102 RepID=UPI001CD5E483|nr:hypothetical protein [Idiomarina abyssalis]
MKNKEQYKKSMTKDEVVLFGFAETIRNNMQVYLDVQVEAAKVIKARYDALIKEGFNESQALELVKGIRPTELL